MRASMERNKTMKPSEANRTLAIKKRIKNEYVFNKMGDVVVGWKQDLFWLLDKVANLEDENEALQEKSDSADRLMQAIKDSILDDPTR